jgi:hypothetical protein
VAASGFKRPQIAPSGALFAANSLLSGELERYLRLFSLQGPCLLSFFCKHGPFFMENALERIKK